ncbi:MAG TPA: copper homeostasis membrane protein CopD [Croceibacterium sp.]
MIEAAILVARLLQYLGAAILFGSSLFFLYALPPTGPAAASVRGWARPLLVGAAVILAASSAGAVAAQASLFAGSWSDGLTREAIGAVVSSMDFGKAAVVRLGAAMAALALLIALPRGRAAWSAAAGAGAVASASLAWMGHAAATEGPWAAPHRVADAIHALAAAAWIGALVVLLRMASERGAGSVQHTALRSALLRFSVVGPLLVTAIVLTGFVNAWVLVGPGGIGALAATPYGLTLLLKLALFAAMVALAAANRFLFTALTAQPGLSLGPLRLSLALETAAGFAVLGVVARLGTLVPPTAA